MEYAVIARRIVNIALSVELLIMTTIIPSFAKNVEKHDMLNSNLNSK
jgi:hypothetical protein